MPTARSPRRSPCSLVPCSAPLFGASGPLAVLTSGAFVAPAAIEDGLAERLELGRRLVPVQNVRRRGKADMPNNGYLPGIVIEPDSFAVTIDGEMVEPAPAVSLRMTQRYF